MSGSECTCGQPYPVEPGSSSEVIFTILSDDKSTRLTYARGPSGGIVVTGTWPAERP